MEGKRSARKSDHSATPDDRLDGEHTKAPPKLVGCSPLNETALDPEGLAESEREDRTASSDLLESLAAVEDRHFASELLASPHIAEVMAVSTCNRVEIYCEVDRFHAAVDDVVASLAKGAGMTADEVTALAYVHYEERAVQHLFEVTSGLDSMTVANAFAS